MNPSSALCPLCQSSGEMFYGIEFQKCSGCKSIFRLQEYFVSASKEQARYEEHNNDIKNPGYQNFVTPMVNMITENHTPNQIGLDFGAGTGPVISYLLEQKGYTSKLYDPFFHNHPQLLEQKYDFIIACEVVEHFFKPKKEFELLYSLLKPNGKLYIMTDIYTPEINFETWYYKNDKTHVFFYSPEAFKWIKQNWFWKTHTQEKRCIMFEK